MRRAMRGPDKMAAGRLFAPPGIGRFSSARYNGRADFALRWAEARSGECRMRFATFAALAGMIALAEPALALDKVRFGTNWLADPAAGGFFQAAADGTYAKYGLDVTIVPGGPQSNGGLMLLFGKLEFFMCG